MDLMGRDERFRHLFRLSSRPCMSCTIALLRQDSELEQKQTGRNRPSASARGYHKANGLWAIRGARVGRRDLVNRSTAAANIVSWHRCRHRRMLLFLCMLLLMGRLLGLLAFFALLSLLLFLS